MMVGSVQGVQLVSQQTEEARAARLSANPIRKVVTMLQSISAKVTSEGEKETELHKKYMCYCDNGAGSLGKSIAGAESKMTEVSSNIAAAEQQDAQLTEELKTHRADRAAAKEAMAEATQLREKEAATFAAYKSEQDANILALKGAISAVDRGMGAGAFLQTKAAEALRAFVQSKEDMIDADRQEVLVFLGATQDSEYSPASGEISGILKGLSDEMIKSLSEASAAEEAGIKSYDELMAAKTKEEKACTAAIEDKETRAGELAVSLAEMKNDLGDTEASLADDRALLADLDTNCGKKRAEWDEIVKTRNEELVALADTIRILQDDDALELFKKTLPSAASFVQLKSASSAESQRARALAMIKASQLSTRPADTKLDFIALALRGKKIGFAKVLGMIDSMVAVLKKEQKDDDAKKIYCEKAFDDADDKKKGLERSVSQAQAAMEAAEEGIATLASEIKALQQAISDLDKSVAEATEQRKSENEGFEELMAQNSAAKELLGVAKNRLNQFYNPKMYKAAPKRALSEQDRIVVAQGGTLAPTPAPGGIAGTGVTVFAQLTTLRTSLHGRDLPAPPAETVGAYSKKSESSHGVMQMIDILIKDLDKEMTVGETEEKESQAEYEQMTKDSASTRASNVAALNDKESAKADTEAFLQMHGDKKKSAARELMATQKMIMALHAECDWLLKYFDMRQEARASEVDALGKAKAVLSGADFSLLQKTRGVRASQTH